MAWNLPWQVPRANTEGTNTASVIGCTYYVVVGIIWSIIWYVGLDPIKWVMAYILNEDGFRDRKVRAHPKACMLPQNLSTAPILSAEHRLSAVCNRSCNAWQRVLHVGILTCRLWHRLTTHPRTGGRE